MTITPRASVSVLGLGSDGTLWARIAAPPVDGAANEALLRFLAKTLDVPRSRLAITVGQSSRHKRIVVTGVTSEDLESRLRQVIESSN